MEKYYISTSIAYINAEPHIGFLLELVAADVLARYQRQIGHDVFFLTGTDEHGTKVAQAAEKAGLQPQAYANQISQKFLDLTKDFNIDISQFIRTTNPEHIKHVQVAWQKLAEKGVLQKRSYTGQYCTGCEAFKTEREIVNGRCPIHDTVLEKIEEENWFLIISPAIKEQIKQWLPAVQPVAKQHEIINILDEYDSISVSRPTESLQWGIRVPGDESQVMYVWVDALLNYITGIFLAEKSVTDTWQNQIQLIGKDILKFHAIIWPALLITLELPLPKQLLVHGFVTVDGKKMSKSLGNVITPAELLERYGVDGTRYLLLRQLNFYDDSNFSWADFDAIYNGELANGIGNITARLIGLLNRLPNGPEQVAEYLKQYDSKPIKNASPLAAANFAATLHTANELLKEADLWITEQKPWTWGETDWQSYDIHQFLALTKLIEAAILLDAFMPETVKKILTQLRSLTSEPLFPRING